MQVGPQITQFIHIKSWTEHIYLRESEWIMLICRIRSTWVSTNVPHDMSSLMQTERLSVLHVLTEYLATTSDRHLCLKFCTNSKSVTFTVCLSFPLTNWSYHAYAWLDGGKCSHANNISLKLTSLNVHAIHRCSPSSFQRLHIYYVWPSSW